MKQLPIKKLLVVLVLLLVASSFVYVNFEKYTTKERVPQPYKVTKNPYLAAEYYLKQHQQKVTVNNNAYLFKTLSSDKQTAILLGSRDQLTEAQNQQILAWVKQGGTLIVEASNIARSDKDNAPDKLLNPLGIKLQRAKQSAYEANLYIEDEEQPAHLSFNGSWQLIDEKGIATAWAATDKGIIKLLQFPYGKGKITVLSDATIWRNYYIKNNDHAWLLSYLTAGHPVTILYTPTAQIKEHPSVVLAALKHYPYTLFLLALFILALLCYKGVRSGPLEPAIERNRRQLPLQLTAQGNFLYKQVGQQQLITILQQEIYYLVKKRLPHFEDLATNEQHKLLSKLTQQPITTISQLMTPMTSHTSFSKLEFTRTVIALQAIRNAL